MTIAHDPLAPVSARIALAGSRFTAQPQDIASPVGLRPWGLRRVRPARSGVALPAWTYDPDRQVAVGAAGTPLVAGEPTAVTTSSVDGEDPPSSEDWIND